MVVKKKVFVVGNNFQIKSMFRENRYPVVNTLENADIICFTGGEDVSPEIYNSPKHPKTRSNLNRDIFETDIFKSGLEQKKFMVGICRGAQFLNVMSGGKLWQDVDNHASFTGHYAFCVEKDFSSIEVTSTHHQMIIPGDDARKLLVAYESTRKEDAVWDKKDNLLVLLVRKFKASDEGFEEDVEACFYEKTGCFCFQPHPEYISSPKECTKFFFDTLKELSKSFYSKEGC